MYRRINKQWRTTTQSMTSSTKMMSRSYFYISNRFPASVWTPKLPGEHLKHARSLFSEWIWWKPTSVTTTTTVMQFSYRVYSGPALMEVIPVTWIMKSRIFPSPIRAPNGITDSWDRLTDQLPGPQFPENRNVHRTSRLVLFFKDIPEVCGSQETLLDSGRIQEK